MFEISNTLSFNKEVLVDGNEYDYITRTSLNQGILQTTGFVNQENINPPKTWSLGLLQMTFFYRHKPWYAGQFVRKISAKLALNKNLVAFFTTLFNKQSRKLLAVLVRDVDKVFLNSKIQLPLKSSKSEAVIDEIDFEFIEQFVAELEAQRVAELEAYLLVTGLKDYELTEEEKLILENFQRGNISFNLFKVTEIFNVKNTFNILSRDIKPNSGTVPYVCASRNNNAVSTYISYDDSMKDKGDCILIGGKTFVVTYQPADFFSNDSHNLCLYFKGDYPLSKMQNLFIISCLEKSLGKKYFWGDSISNKKIQADCFELPEQDGFPDFEFMQTLISAIQKLVIKEVVLYADRKIAATKSVINEIELQR